MKSLKKLFAICLAVMMALSIPFSVSADETTDPASIDTSRTGSMTIYKYDLTNAEKDGVWDSSYVSTGVYDEAGVNNVLGGNSTSTLGNGETGYGYAIKGVEFTYVKVADIFQYGESESDNRTDAHVEILYAVDKTNGADFLAALGLADGKNRYENADALDESKYFYQSDVLISALSSGLTANATTVKNAMERYAAANGTAMTLTDSYGKTEAENLPLGLYLVAETKVPEMVVSTTDPFLVSVPMTSVNGTNANDGGTRWIYDVTLYPKKSQQGGLRAEWHGHRGNAGLFVRLPALWRVYLRGGQSPLPAASQRSDSFQSSAAYSVTPSFSMFFKNFGSMPGSICTMSSFSSVGRSSASSQKVARSFWGIPYTARSMSLRSLLSPLAREPKSTSRWAPWRRASSAS